MLVCQTGGVVRHSCSVRRQSSNLQRQFEPRRLTPFSPRLRLTVKILYTHGTSSASTRHASTQSTGSGCVEDASIFSTGSDCPQPDTFHHYSFQGCPFYRSRSRFGAWSFTCSGAVGWNPDGESRASSRSLFHIFCRSASSHQSSARHNPPLQLSGLSILQVTFEVWRVVVYLFGGCWVESRWRSRASSRSLFHIFCRSASSHQGSRSLSRSLLRSARVSRSLS